jgi:two-component system OmpR family sensor kinase
MTLTARLTGFFLAVLACVLAGFSIGLYCLASSYLHHQTADRLTSALHTLAAAADVGSEGIEWEPSSRSLSLGQDSSPDEIRWLVRDGRGHEVDRSKNLADIEAAGFLNSPEGASNSIDSERSCVFADGATWRLQQTRIAAPANPKSPSPAADEPSTEPAGKLYSQLLLMAGISLAPVEATLRNLALALGGLSLGLWCLAAISGRSLCRQALAPVTRMADTARSMTADDRQARLPTPDTGDELQDLAVSFNGLLARLEDSYERQRRFTGDASHQLRTPLAGMLGQVDVALLRDRSPEEYRRVLEAVRSQVHRLRQIVETQLFMARADAESLKPQMERLDLARWLPTHLESWREHSRWADIAFQNTAPGKIETNAHPQLLAQLLDNLLDNAAKYSSPGTPITVRLTVADGKTECSVEDAGPGIAADDLPHIFEPFFRSAQARRSGVAGAGLGLAVAQRIAAALGGTLRAENLSTGGARLILRLTSPTATRSVSEDVRRPDPSKACAADASLADASG